MPYIKQDYRNQLDPAITNLIKTLKDSAVSASEKSDPEPGFVAYCLYRIMTEMTYKSYDEMCKMVGTVDLTIKEFHRRVIVPYEEIKLVENGDVF